MAVDLRKHRIRPAAQRYGMMALCISAAFALTALVPQLRERESFMVFFAAIAYSAWYGGRGPGILSCVLSAMITDYFLYEPRYSFSLGVEAFITHIFFILIAFMISSLTTNLMRSEQETREQRQWFEAMLSSIGEAVIATDADGKVTYLNAAAENLLGKSVSEVKGRDVHEALEFRHLPGSPSSAPLIQKALQGDLGVRQSEPMLLARGGSNVTIEYLVAPIKDDQNNLSGVVLAIRDTSEREAARGKIMAYQEDLRSLAAQMSLVEERERRRIASSLHDRVGQALALSTIKLRTLRAGITDTALTEPLDQIGLLLKDMLTETRSLTFELSPPILYEFGLEAALEWLCSNFQKNNNLSCVFINPGDARPMEQNVRIALFQSVRELLTNVVKHAQASEVSVRIEKECASIAVIVEDDGIGFDTVAQAQSRQMQGFGLFTVRERMRHLGGSVALKSSRGPRGQGTSVALHVPHLES